jgi:hypothetical protein
MCILPLRKGHCGPVDATTTASMRMLSRIKILAPAKNQIWVMPIV